MLGDEFEGAHGAEPADIADRHALALGLDRLQPRHDGLALLLGLFQQAFLLEGLEDAERCRAGDGIAGIGAAKAAGIRRVHDLGAADDAGQRKAAGQDLGHRHQIGLDAEMLHGEPFAGAPEARLDFIGDQHDAMLVAELAQAHHAIPWAPHRSRLRPAPAR